MIWEAKMISPQHLGGGWVIQNHPALLSSESITVSRGQELPGSSAALPALRRGRAAWDGLIHVMREEEQVWAFWASPARGGFSRSPQTEC